MNAPFPKPCPCDFAPNPLIGFSSETPDVATQIGLGFGPSVPPPLGSTWNNPTAFVALDVPVTQPRDQKVADLLAEAAAFRLAAAGWTDPTGFPVVTFDSAEQSVQETCPDGSTFTFGVVPGLFTDLTQKGADDAALSYCQLQILLHKVCLGGVMPTLCVNQSADVTITASGVSLRRSGKNLWELTSGEIPLGMVFNGGPASSDSMTITGIPTKTGVFMFTVKVTTPQGDFMEKSFSLTVVGVTSAVLSSAQTTVPYSSQLIWSGFDAPAFSVDPSSALPPGLTMNSMGFISGTPTVPGDYTLLVDVTDSVANCQVEISLSISTYPTYKVTPDLTGAIAYFLGGASFPAGTYQIGYVNGAVQAPSPPGWYLNCGICNGGAGYYYYVKYPGSSGPFGDPVFNGTGTGFASQAAVESANNGRFWQFDHAGGQIGLYCIGGFTAGSPNPTFSLTRIG